MKYTMFAVGFMSGSIIAVFWAYHIYVKLKATERLLEFTKRQLQTCYTKINVLSDQLDSCRAKSNSKG